GAVDCFLHPPGERVHRSLKPGQIGEHELVLLVVGDAEDAPPGRVRNGRGDRDLVATERIDERGLADVGTARDRDEPGAERRHSSNVSGSSSAGVIVRTSSPWRNTTRSTPISASHWRQPPHGDAVTATTAKAPGRQPSAIGRAKAGHPPHPPS